MSALQMGWELKISSESTVVFYVTSRFDSRHANGYPSIPHCSGSCEQRDQAWSCTRHFDPLFREREGTLMIKDDGIDSSHRRNATVIGLRIMNYRAGMIGGNLEVRPDSPRGTIVTCRFPIGAAPTA
jgi:hypothetical protein